MTLSSRRSEEPAICPHIWKETGRADWTVPIRNGKPVERRVLWTWLKCPLCGQNGFRRDASPVVYTWRPEHMESVY